MNIVEMKRRAVANDWQPLFVVEYCKHNLAICRAEEWGINMDEMKKDAMTPENATSSGMDGGGQDPVNNFMNDSLMDNNYMDHNAMGNNPKNKNPKDMVKFIIPAAVCVVLVLLLIGVTVATGVFGNKNDVILDALGKTFTESAEAMGDTWRLDGYEDMFSDKQAYMEADLTLADSVQMGMEINIDQELYNAHMDIGYYGFSLLEADLYIDEYEILLGMPGLIDKVFYVDRDTFDGDIERLALEYDLDEAAVESLKSLNMGSKDLVNANEEMEMAGQQLKDAVLAILKKAEIKKADGKKLTVDGKERSCKGYVLTITGRQAAEVFLTCKDIYEGNTAFQNYINQLRMGMEGYSSVEELLEYENPAQELQRYADELVEEGDTDIYFYVYKDVLAQIYCEDGEVVLEWNIQGGNFPLENMEFSLTTDSTDFVITRTGSVKGDKYLADYELEVDGDELALNVERSKKDGDFRFELIYGYDEMLLEGGIKEGKTGVEFTIEIDTFELDGEEILRGDILFSKEYEEEIVKPEGEKVNVMDLTEDDWYEILWEISENLYY